MAKHLPTELIVELLLRLPSKSLISFRSVCKSWLSLISSTQFRLMYLRRNFSRNLVRRVSWKENKEMYSIHFNDQHFTLDTSVAIEFPFNLHRGGIISFWTIGCCNGVICLSDYMSGRDETILWNPSIRSKITLIPPIYRYSHSQNLYLVLGFGYDKMTDDYKVVRLAYNNRSFTMTIPHVEVYTVRTAIWRVVEFPRDLPYCVFLHLRVPVFFNGSSHWIACSNSGDTHSSILTFDMSTERFGEIQLPENLAKESPLKLGLVVVEKSLGVIYSNRPFMSTSSSYEIWGMKDYKNPASWTTIYKLHYPDKDAGITLGLTNNGSLIKESTQGRLTIHNQEGCYHVFGSGSQGIDSEMISVVGYEESLALLDVGDDVNVWVQASEDE